MDFERIREAIRVLMSKECRRGFHITGRMKSRLTRSDGGIYYFEKQNLITDDGFDFIADVIGNTTQPNELTHIAVGTGDTAADVTDTTLETEAARAAATYAHTGGSKVFTLEATFGAGSGTGALTESGCLNAASDGVLFNRVVFSEINKGAGDSLTQTFEITMS